jgi:hypothetical protein
MGMIGNQQVLGVATPANVSDQNNTSTGAFDVPVGTTAQRPASPTSGYLRYNTDTSQLEIYNGSAWGNVTPAVTPANVSDQSNTSTGGFDVPSGTTAQRPSSPNTGYLRFNTDLDCMENYTSAGWLKVSIPIPVLVSVTGTIYAGATSTLTLAGSQFGASAGTVRFTSGATVKDVTVTPASASSLTVAVPSEIYSLSSGSSVDIKFTNGDGGQSGSITKTSVGIPSGGTITTSGNYRIHTFTSSASLTVPSGFTTTADYLVVAGGGGGGSTGTIQAGGGGGAGGYLAGTTTLSAGSTYSFVIGSGGSLGTSGTAWDGTNGNNTTGFGLTAIGGGGGGGQQDRSGLSGGSGGGRSSGGGTGSGGSGTSGQGYAGGGVGSQSTPYVGGGGGGASRKGYDITDATNTPEGGDGLQWVNGSYYAGGGGAGERDVSYGPGYGGNGGGGNGGRRSPPGTAAVAGTAYTGGGGGGGCGDSSGANGANGGAGVVIVRYLLT